LLAATTTEAKRGRRRSQKASGAKSAAVVPLRATMTTTMKTMTTTMRPGQGAKKTPWRGRGLGL
jgi:hypothetical protein